MRSVGYWMPMQQTVYAPNLNDVVVHLHKQFQCLPAFELHMASDLALFKEQKPYYRNYLPFLVLYFDKERRHDNQCWSKHETVLAWHSLFHYF